MFEKVPERAYSDLSALLFKPFSLINGQKSQVITLNMSGSEKGPERAYSDLRALVSKPFLVINGPKSQVLLIFYSSLHLAPSSVRKSARKGLF